MIHKFKQLSYINIQSFIRSETRKAESFRFAITGSLAVFIQYGVYYILITVSDLNPTFSTFVSYAISFCVNFLMSNYFTFHSRPNKKKFLAFATSHFINLILQVILVETFCLYFNPRIALIPALVICVPINFLFVRFALKSKYFQNK